uniref:Uncharacterized protein n=1 Tax=Fibrocapsa japonica TaxID=94617 RepID=A0A7S2Y093_9STRA
MAGATPGVHFPESRFYIRRVRLDRRSELVPSLLACGYKIEEAATDKTAVVVEIPVDVGDGVRTLGQVSMWEQLALAAFMQRYWADNQVSVTVTFDPKTEGAMLPFALDYYQYQLKGVTFLPRLDCGAFEQMPYESIAKEAYEKMVIKIKPFSLQIADLDSSSSSADDVEECPEKFCDGDKCEMRALNGSAKKRAKLMQA